MDVVASLPLGAIPDAPPPHLDGLVARCPVTGGWRLTSETAGGAPDDAAAAAQRLREWRDSHERVWLLGDRADLEEVRAVLARRGGQLWTLDTLDLDLDDVEPHRAAFLCDDLAEASALLSPDDATAAWAAVDPGRGVAVAAWPRDGRTLVRWGDAEVRVGDLGLVVHDDDTVVGIVAVQLVDADAVRATRDDDTSTVLHGPAARALVASVGGAAHAELRPAPLTTVYARPLARLHTAARAAADAARPLRIATVTGEAVEAG